jgi:hypothetical protein
LTYAGQKRGGEENKRTEVTVWNLRKKRDMGRRKREEGKGEGMT